ncbi:hypothetical protein [Parasulfitobacter algicola]|uniref:Uncharacterized protein n=1 Tax=Parasulfitobacter algicola TaxID=2614809 RepID=A0ABX2IVX7_9RHOB|nr:hypothetical protein [Sulfitobacter algicola]NSX56670.1 hypothetical protein [Sulfitobacter algicola]
MILRIAIFICLALALFFGYVWAFTLYGGQGQGEVGAIIYGPIMLLSFGLLFVFWALMTWLAWLRHRKTWLAIVIFLALPIFAVVWNFSINPVKDIEKRCALIRAERFVDARLEALASVPQTVETLKAERERFAKDAPRTPRNDYDGPIHRTKARYYILNSLYLGIIFDDPLSHSYRENPPVQPECTQFPQIFADVYDPDMHQDRYIQYCGVPQAVVAPYVNSLL